MMYRFELGRTHVMGKDWEGARRLFQGLLGEAEDNPRLFARVLFNLGLTNERTGRFDDSVEIFQRLLALEPDNHEALNYLGYMLAEKGLRLGEAENLVGRALKAQPENGAYLDSMGWIRYQQAQYREARTYLGRALAVEEAEFKAAEGAWQRANLAENLAVIHDHAGDVAKALGDLEGARRHWKRAAKLNPEDGAIRSKLDGSADPSTDDPADAE
jgi:tetratricopeptide (TPR) repeat protein